MGREDLHLPDNRSWENAWDGIYKKVGIPEDLQHPYGCFNYLMNEMLRRKTRKVLDVAMGPGRHSIEMAKNGLEVYGFDLSNTALELAQNKFVELGLTIDTRVANMFGEYPYEDNYFDAVIAIQAIYHGYPDDMLKSFKEIHRVLKPGGFFGFTLSIDCERPMVDFHGTKKTPRARNDKNVEKIGEFTYIFHTGRESGVPHSYPDEATLLSMLNGKFNDVKGFTDYDRMYRMISASAIK
jgi:ubiquinone/menaquinone biosynthesis C-methylase UbiE